MMPYKTQLTGMTNSSLKTVESKILDKVLAFKQFQFGTFQFNSQLISRFLRSGADKQG